MKNIIVITILSMALFACKSTSSSTSNVTNSIDKSTPVKVVSIEDSKTKEMNNSTEKQEMKEKIMMMPIDKQQLKTIPVNKVEEK